jgi:hypothetical protein
MNYWDSVGRWLNTLLVLIVGVIAFDALFRLLEANDGNVIVRVVRVLAALFLVPFQGMFGEQDFILTSLIAVLGYALLVGVALGVLRSLQASTRWSVGRARQHAAPSAGMSTDTAARQEAAPAQSPQSPQSPQQAQPNSAGQTPTTRPAERDGARANGHTAATPSRSARTGPARPSQPEQRRSGSAAPGGDQRPRPAGAEPAVEQQASRSSSRARLSARTRRIGRTADTRAAKRPTGTAGDG